jgi:hypothetical protein
MKTWPVAALLALSFATRASADDQATPWITDYTKAKAAARASGKPIFLVFRCER